MDTPGYLLSTLDLITAPKIPKASLRAGGVAHAESLHMQRVRDIFEDKNIVAIGISEKATERKDIGVLGLTFYVEKKLAKRSLKAGKLIPPVMAAPNGKAVFTDVKELGKVRPEAPLRRAKPIQSGYSVAHVDDTAGTVGAIVVKDGKYFILSNSHVLANAGLAKLKANIVYPGPSDLGTMPKHFVGRLAKFIKFKTGGDFVNRVDAALCAIDKSRLGDLDFSIYGMQGTPKTLAPKRGMTVMKRGRTTGESAGEKILDINFRVVVDYDGVGQIGFTDQVLCERYSKPGDSGSIVCDQATGRILGLHFSGAPGGSVFNPIAAVIAALRFKFATK